MRTLRNLALAGALAACTAISQAAFSQEAASYPHLTGSGEGLSIAYGPGPHGNIVGGGAVRVRNLHSENLELTHLNAQYAQHRTDGRVPLAVGTGERSSVVYVTPTPSSDLSPITLLRRLRS
ncbi:hypothetical protein [Sediminicoccus rosea]|uniref:Uncharacterized protein n=1 Tax=Sediminicoccus rosea TaxID=1225128 RepID=A0ABZ0PD92_9PROT|nr:hypothetical protein [Sediminicoccus rosea]WPB83668.1 hypothetical protein R9Z33_16325 [Sediminicoccus rosea]